MRTDELPRPPAMKWHGTEIERRCYSCGMPIFECMGITKGGDFREMYLGIRTVPRELCGHCAECFEWTEHGTLRSPRAEAFELWALNSDGFDCPRCGTDADQRHNCPDSECPFNSGKSYD